MNERSVCRSVVYSVDSRSKDRPLAESTHVGFPLAFQSEWGNEESTQKLGLESQRESIILTILEKSLSLSSPLDPMYKYFSRLVVGLRDPNP